MAHNAHVAHVDVATGTQSAGDRWAAAIAHREGNTAILDALLVIHPPFSVATAAQSNQFRRRDAKKRRGDGRAARRGQRQAGRRGEGSRRADREDRAKAEGKREVKLPRRKLASLAYL